MFTLENKAPVVWIMQGDKRLAGVHWSLHDGQSYLAQEFAQKIVDALNGASKLIERKH